MGSKPTDVTIIGAGLAGTLLALSLHDHLPLAAQSIRIYESRPSNATELASGVVMTPNGLTVLQHLGVLPRLSPHCWTNGYRTYKNARDETTKRVLVASRELYGFVNHRCYRRVLLRTVKDMLEERGVAVTYGARFGGVTSSTPESVTFLINGSPHETALLVGADGINSTVRRHLSPVVPEFTGVVGCVAHMAWSSVSWPTADFERQCTIQGGPGAIFMIPETRDGEDVMVGMQVRQDTDVSRGEWERLSRDTEAMCGFWRRGYGDWHATGRKVIDAVTAAPARETLYLWPFMRMPRLAAWFAPAGDVVVVGDAAHAVPPSSGQGVNQALEDVWSLTLLLRDCPVGVERAELLGFWQGIRQRRIDAVYEWATNATNVVRLGEDERRRLVAEGKIPDPEMDGGVGFDDMRWLYGYKSEKEVEAWLAEKKRDGMTNGGV